MVEVSREAYFAKIIDVQPCGVTWLDPAWKNTTVIVEKEHNGNFSHVRPSRCTRLDDEYQPDPKDD